MMAGTQERSDKRRREDLLPMIYPESRLPKRIEADQMAARDFLDGDDEKMVATHDGGIVAGEQWRQVASSITPGDVDELIARALEAAGEAQGSDAQIQGASSQPFALNSSVEQDGSGKPDEDHSQRLRAEARRAVEGFLRDPRASCTIGDLGEVLWDVLNILEKDFSCRPRPMAGGRAIFPLPVSGHPMVTQQGTQFLRLVAACLNSMHGVPNADRGRPSSLRAMKRLQGVLASSVILREPLPTVDFSQLFQVKGVDYQGEEIRLARNVVWESIEASLPDHVGKLDLDHCEGGVLHYVTHFEDFLFPPCDQVIGKPPRVFVDDGDWETVARGLLERGICVRRRVSELHHVDGRPLYNGLFSVSKEEFNGPIELCRLIMNLKPVNQLSRPLEGDTSTLPMITQMTSLYLDDDEILVTSSEDLRCYFYLFAVPEAWFKYLGFGKTLPQSLVPVRDRDDDWVLCSRVLPMGYLNSVAIAQHIHRNIVRRCMGDLRPPKGAEGELRRDRPFSHKPELFRVYLDNFDELKKLDRRTYDQVRGTPSEAVLSLREAYAKASLPTHRRRASNRKLERRFRVPGWTASRASCAPSPVKWPSM